MKAENDIDKLFRKGIQKEYPYDEKLWSQVESELPDINTAAGSNWRNGLKFLFVLFFVLFLKTDSIVSLNHYDSIEIEEPSEVKSNVISTNQLAVKNQEASSQEANTLSNKHQDQNREDSQLAEIKENNLSKSIISENSNVALEESSRLNERTESPQNLKLEESTEKLKKRNENDLESNEITQSPDFELSSSFDKKPDVLGLSNLSRMSSLDFLIASNNNQALPKSADRNKLNELQQKFKKRDYLIELEYGHSIMLEKKVSGLDKNLSEYRDESENSRYAQSVGLNILTDIKRFTLGLGVHLSTYHEQLNYSYNKEVNRINVSYDTSYTVVNGNYNSNGTPVILIRENINENRTEVTENVGRELVVNNYFKRISMPLSIGYTKVFGRFNAGLRTALVFNYLYESSGGYISSNRDNFYGFEEKNQLQDWVIGNRNQLRLGYSLNEFVSVGTSFNYEHDLSSFTNNYNSRFNTYGLGFWLLYRPN